MSSCWSSRHNFIKKIDYSCHDITEKICSLVLNNNLPITLHFYLFPFSIGAKTQPESKCPELLANYCDMLLRKTPLSKKLTSEEVETKLKDVVRLIY